MTVPPQISQSAATRSARVAAGVAAKSCAERAQNAAIARRCKTRKCQATADWPRASKTCRSALWDLRKEKPVKTATVAIRDRIAEGPQSATAPARPAVL